MVQQDEPQQILLNPADPYVEDFVSDINRARVLRVHSVMTDMEEGLPADISEVDCDDTLESAIAHSEGETHKSYVVIQAGKPVGTLHMKDLVKALVPRIASESATRMNAGS